MSRPEGKLTFGLDHRPSEVRHQNGCWFMVEEVLCGRERDCWRMRVWGPLPGNPRERGKFVMTAKGTGDSLCWKIAPGPQECECGEAGQPS